MVSPPMLDPQEIPDGMTSKQYVWDNYGRWIKGKVAERPELYILRGSPFESEPWGQYLIELLGPLDGKTVLDAGCGLGSLSVHASKEGAKVFAIDLLMEIVRAARSIANVNGVRCQFQRANISKLPFIDNSFDIVLGIGILHHLSKPDVITSLEEIHRVLREGGKAVFQEPVENSRTFSFIQNLFPAGNRHFGYYRPSCLSRKAWVAYLAKQEDRDMTNQELSDAGTPFEKVLLTPFGLFIRFDRFIKSMRLIRLLHAIDHYIFILFPFLRRFARGVLVEYQK